MNLPGPPDYAQAKNRRQKQRAAGLHPDYWYPVEWDKALKIGESKEVVFWKRSIAIYRGADGKVRALENRCGHRQLKLTEGIVKDCRLTCTYHGWTYDETGKCVEIPHDLCGSKMPNVRIGAYPAQVKHGLIWIFPGNPALAATRAIPEIPELSRGWSHIDIDFTWNAHHSMIIDNTCDFTHAYLHRVRKPFTDAKLKNLQTQGDSVVLSYDTQVGQGRFTKLFVNRKKTNTNAMSLGYEYPYQWSNTDDRIKHWCFCLPIAENKTRAFFIFYFSPDMLQLPFLPLRVPKLVANVIMRAARELAVRPLLDEDGIAVEAEQIGYDAHFDKPIPDVNPVVREFQALTIRKWEEYLATTVRAVDRAANEEVAAN